MRSTVILLNTIDKVKSFVSDVSKFDVDMELVSGKYVVDAKSILGIFSLHLLRPMELQIYGDDVTSEEVLQSIQNYVFVS